MARYIAHATGDSDAAGTWGKVTNTPTIHGSTNITVSASGIFSTTFTAPSTSNVAKGVMVAFNQFGTAGTITATLQEDIGGVGSWADVAASSAYTLSAFASGLFMWVYFPLTSNYTFATTGANRYRWKLNTASASGTTSVRADSGGTLFCFCSTDDTGTTPAVGDQCWLGGNGSSQITVTAKNGFAFGNGETALVGNASVTTDMKLDNSILKWDTAASTTVTCRGQILVGCNGELQIGTVATPYPTGLVATLSFDYSAGGTSGDMGIYQQNSTTTKVIVQGLPAVGGGTTNWKTKYVSGTGTAASPLVTSTAVDWNVNDEIVVTATAANGQSEYKFIKTKNSSTSYVLSDTAGGAEAALTHTHSTEAHIINLTRNVIITSTDSTKGWYYRNIVQTAGNADWDWVRLHRAGGTGSSRIAFQMTDSDLDEGDCDYCVFYESVDLSFRMDTSKVTQSFTGLVVARQRAATTQSCITLTSGSNNKTFTDCFVIGAQRQGMNIASSFNVTLNNFYIIDCNQDNTATVGPLQLNIAQVVANDCDFACNLQQDIYAVGTGVNHVFNDCRFSPYGTAASKSILSLADTFQSALFNNCTFGSATLFTPNLTLLPGSEIRFHKYQQTADNHLWYTTAGIASSTGAGLSDTTLHTSGSGYKAMRVESQDSANNFIWDFDVPTGNIQNKTMTIAVWVKINSATYYAGTHQKPTLSVTYDTETTSSSVATGTTDWQQLSVTFTPTTTAESVSVSLNNRTDATGSNAYVYWDDMSILYPPGVTLNLGGFDAAWIQAQPATPPISTSISAADVWTVPTSTLTTAGTTGKQQKDMLTTGKFLGLK